MRKTKKANITAESLSTLAGQAVAHAKGRRAEVLLAAQLEEAVGGLAIDRGAADLKIKIGGGGATEGYNPYPGTKDILI